MNTANNILQECEQFISELFSGESSGHDFWHIKRVYNLSMFIAEKEDANKIICGLGAWLHEFDDPKLLDITGGKETATTWMKNHKVPDEIMEEVSDIISSISYRGAGVSTPMKTLQGEVVQDADRLDAMGAIGIARTFTYGGSKGRLIYHPDIKPVCHTSPAAYYNKTGPTINHFYEKLLLLKERMNTATGKELANERHEFLESYLKQFYKEWYMRQ